MMNVGNQESAMRLAVSGGLFPNRVDEFTEAMEARVRELGFSGIFTWLDEDHGVVLGMEGHVLVTLNSAELMRGVLDEVGSPAVRCDLDPVNWLTLATVFRNGAAIDQMVDLLGTRIFNAHAKDVRVEKRLV